MLRFLPDGRIAAIDRVGGATTYYRLSFRLTEG